MTMNQTGVRGAVFVVFTILSLVLAACHEPSQAEGRTDAQPLGDGGDAAKVTERGSAEHDANSAGAVATSQSHPQPTAEIDAPASVSTTDATWPWEGKDADADGIADDYEQGLAERFQVVVKTNRNKSIRPISVRDAYTKGDRPGVVIERRQSNGKWTHERECTVESLSELSATQDMSNAKAWSRLNWEEIDWTRFRPANKPTLFWKLTWINRAERLLSLQMYWFCTFSDADAPGNRWDHDGDWLGVQIRISAADHQNPIATSAVFYNHNRVLEGPREVLTFESDRLVIFAEDNCNEAWPLPGEKGQDFEVHMKRDHRWKCVEGDCNQDIQKLGYAFPRSYTGNGARIHDWQLVSVGEEKSRSGNNSVECRLFYGNFQWGKRHGGGTTLPTSPPYNTRMWTVR